jgi:hypothetical protein
MADAVSQISSAVIDIKEIARELREGDITPETRQEWQLFVEALADALDEARSLLCALPRPH